MTKTQARQQLFKELKNHIDNNRINGISTLLHKHANVSYKFPNQKAMISFLKEAAHMIGRDELFEQAGFYDDNKQVAKYVELIEAWEMR